MSLSGKALDGGGRDSEESEKLSNRTIRSKIGYQQVGRFQPALDVCFDDTDLVSHVESRIFSIPVYPSGEGLLLIQKMAVVGTDEAQLFDEDLSQACIHLASRGISIDFAGQDMDFQGKPSGPVSHLPALPDYITPLHAIFYPLRKDHPYFYRTSCSHSVILLGQGSRMNPDVGFALKRAEMNPAQPFLILTWKVKFFWVR
ncbi:MAG: thymidine kinase [Chitinophagaceae bacterium]